MEEKNDTHSIIDNNISFFEFEFVEPPISTITWNKFMIAAASEMEAWKLLSFRLSKDIKEIKELNPTIVKRVIPQAEIITSEIHLQEESIIWANTLKEGVAQICNTIKETIGVTRGERIKKEKEVVKTDRLILLIFGFGFLSSLFFAFFLIYIDKLTPVFNFIFPIITAIIGLISGQLWGRGGSNSAT